MGKTDLYLKSKSKVTEVGAERVRARCRGALMWPVGQSVGAG